jgi:outer membrane receptor protein involved in Fe transport
LHLRLPLLVLIVSHGIAALRGADAAAEKAQQLDQILVEGKRYQPTRNSLPPGLRFLMAPPLPGMSFGGMGLGLPSAMERMVVTATRAPQTLDQVSATIRLLDGPAIRETPAVTLDGALRSIPAFSLFRRSDSFTAHPTAQGVSLRGLGPSGASRSLILLDGAPLNDPFGGWVTWTKLPREGLARAEIVPGGGATAWGNAALGGVVQLFAAATRTELNVLDEPPKPAWITTGHLRFAAIAGDYGTRSAELALTLPTSQAVLQLLGRTFATDGFPLVAPERRGSIDIPAWSRHRWFMARWKQPVSPKLELMATARFFEEKRGNGTPYQKNGSREKFVSLALAGQPAETFAWNALGYVQSQSFASTFSAVNATRTAETPASDQFHVPATAFGAAWTGVWQPSPADRASFGADTRFVRGETRENFTFSNGVFTRQRVAGGEQTVAGLFAMHERRLRPTLRATLGARFDAWSDADGHRRETDRLTGAVLRDDRYAKRDGTTFSPSAGLVWTPARAWRIRASAQKAFRRPTLNELYRPFRVGPNVTEANAELRTERTTSAELGAEWTLWRQPPPALTRAGQTAPGTPPAAALLTLGATGFTNDLHDAVGNVTLVRGPGTFPMFGFIAAGGVGRQRLNLERTRVRGLELSARWAAAKALTITGDYLYNDARVRRTTLAPQLIGKRVAQVPRDSAALGATWRALDKLTLTPRLRWLGRQFEDDENQLTLGAVVIADLSIGYALTRSLELFVTTENVGDARIETGRTADGIVNVGTPRLALFGLRGSW